MSDKSVCGHDKSETLSETNPLAVNDCRRWTCWSWKWRMMLTKELFWQARR